MNTQTNDNTILQNNINQLLKEDISKNRNDLSQETLIEGNSKEDSQKIITDANNYFLVKILSPEVKENEQKKREHKDKLIELIENFLKVQLKILVGLIFITLVTIFLFHFLQNDFEIEYFKLVIGIVGVYITSVVVELIAMLKYVVENVFDTSITKLVELFRTNYNDNRKEWEEN